jgi:hypothetical protein
MSSFSSRLISVRDVLITSEFSTFYNEFNSQEKLRISFNLNPLNFLFYPEFYYLKKKDGFVKVTQSFSLYFFSFSCLLNLSLLPFVENKSDKFTFFFKSFYYYDDFFAYVKSLFLMNKEYNCYMKVPISSSFNFVYGEKFKKDWPFLKLCINSLMQNQSFFTLSNETKLFNYNKNIKYTIFNYIFNGLVRIL